MHKRVKIRLEETTSKTQWVSSQDCWEGRRTSQDVTLKGTIGVSRFGATAATLDEASRTDAEITLV